MEKDYMGIHKVENDAELELGLGLSLACKGSSATPSAAAWGDYGRRILTAKDFPNGFPSSAAADVASASANGVSQVLVGWPPIGAHRMNSLVNQAKNPSVEEEDCKGVGGNEKEEESGGGGGSKMKKVSRHHGGNNHNNMKNIEDGGQERGVANLGFVKVNVHGLPIGRKVDLTAHTCYESLAKALEDMFFKSWTSGGEKDPAKKASKLLDGSSEFVLTYEDKEGDWMLVGDVPWGMFLDTVKRLRIMKTSETNRLAPRQKGKAM